MVFEVDDVSQIFRLVFGADYDDGFAAWINGVEVVRSSSMPAGPPDWNSTPTSTESSNAAVPQYEQIDISVPGIAALLNGQNVLAVGIWNDSGGSSDLVLVPQLILNDEFPVIDAGSLVAPRIAVEDIDGEGRIVDGDGDGVRWPDIGADERR